jgi:hypothetical protein
MLYPGPIARKTCSWLDPLPIERDDTTWTYRLTGSGHVFPVSITGVLSRVTKTEEAMLWIEAWREVWEPRGNTCHAALQHFAHARWGGPKDLWPLPDRNDPIDWSALPDPRGATYGAYGDWIEPLMAEPIWDHVQVIGAEVMLYDLAANVAGTMDLVVRFPDGSCGLADLKSLSEKGKKYDTRAQLGAGIHMAELRYGLPFSRGLTIWCAPGQCHIQTHPAAECTSRWQQVFSRYLRDWRPF